MDSVVVEKETSGPGWSPLPIKSKPRLNCNFSPSHKCGLKPVSLEFPDQHQ